LQAIDLRRWEQNSNKEISWGPHTPIDTLNAKNRLPVLACLLFVYNQQLSLIQKPALYHLCKMTSQIVNQGFTKYGHSHRASYGSDPGAMKPLPRIPLSEKFLLELLHATYFAMFNEFASAAIQAVDDVHSRACFEIFPDVVLVTNAIRNSLYANPSGQPSDGPMGISVALTPASQTVTVSKSMITNASFRTKKLPGRINKYKISQFIFKNLSYFFEDDIPIVPKEDPSQLQSIHEEAEAEIPKAAVKPKEAKLHMPFAAGFKKLKDKDKEKDKEKSTNKNVNPEVVKRTKDKILSKNISSSDMIDSEKNSPQTLMKRKSSNLDIAGPSTNEFASSVANGSGGGGSNSVNNSDSGLTIGSERGSMEVGESFDSGNDLVSNSSLRPSNDMKNHGSMQVSQV
jgi:protein FAM126